MLNTFCLIHRTALTFERVTFRALTNVTSVCSCEVLAMVYFHANHDKVELRKMASVGYFEIPTFKTTLNSNVQLNFVRNYIALYSAYIAIYSKKKINMEFW